MKQVLVLGGSGFLGGHVCEKLVRAGYRVSVATRKAVHARAVMHLPGLTVLECNVHDEAALGRAMVGMDAVINLVAILHGSPAAFTHVHQDLPEKIARACLAQHVQHLVHLSALGVRSHQPEVAPSHYLRSKGLGEALLADTLGLGARPSVHPSCGLTLLRPSVIFGVNDKFLNVFSRLQALVPVMPLACAQARFQPVWVEDVASAVLKSLAQGLAQAPSLRVYELAGPQVYTLRQLVQFAARCSGINHGRGRPVLGLPLWVGRLQVMVLKLMPGEPLMSADNLASMQTDNVVQGEYPGLATLDIQASALEAIGPQYLVSQAATKGLLGLRHRHR
jgi:NADH dehydrogenase